MGMQVDQKTSTQVNKRETRSVYVITCIPVYIHDEEL